MDQLITSINAERVAVWEWADNPSKDWGFIKAKSATHTHAQTRTGMPHMSTHRHTHTHTHDLPGISIDICVRTRILSQTNL